MGILNLGEKLIETPEKWRKMMPNLAKEKPSVKQKKVKKKASWAGCEPPASPNRSEIYPPAHLGLLERSKRNDKIRKKNQWEKNR